MIDKEILKKINQFSYTQAKKENQRPNRSGSIIKREPIQVYFDTMMGKLAEFYVIKNIKELGFISTELDLEIYDRGKWDNYDIKIFKDKLEKIIQVKCIKSFSKYLLLETDEYSDLTNSKSDFIFSVKCNFTESKCKNAIETNFNEGKFEILERIVLYCIDLKLEIYGFIDQSIYQKGKEEKQLFFKGHKLGNSFLQVDNYHYDYDNNLLKNFKEFCTNWESKC